MSQENMQAQVDELAKVSLVTLSQAIELGRQVFSDIAGRDLAAEVEGKEVSGAMISDLIAAKLNARLNTQSTAQGA